MPLSQTLLFADSSVIIDYQRIQGELITWRQPLTSVKLSDGLLIEGNLIVTL